MSLAVVDEARVAPVGEWSVAQLEGAARALSMLVVQRRAYRGEQTYLAAARLLISVTDELEAATAREAAVAARRGRA